MMVMKDARKKLLSNAGIYVLFKKETTLLPGIAEETLRKCHSELLNKTINARAGTIFKQFHDLFIGHYSKTLNVEFRKYLQCASKKAKHSSDATNEEYEEE